MKTRVNTAATFETEAPLIPTKAPSLDDVSARGVAAGMNVKDATAKGKRIADDARFVVSLLKFANAAELISQWWADALFETFGVAMAAPDFKMSGHPQYAKWRNLTNAIGKGAKADYSLKITPHNTKDGVWVDIEKHTKTAPAEKVCSIKSDGKNSATVQPIANTVGGLTEYAARMLRSGEHDALTLLEAALAGLSKTAKGRRTLLESALGTKSAKRTA